MKEKDPAPPVWQRLSGIGVEFAGAVGGLALLGYWIDLRWDTKPWGLLICTAIGLIGGSYNLIRESIAASKPKNDPDSKSDKKT